MSSYSVQFSSLCELGNREEQEDAIDVLEFDQRCRFIVIDGMGGTLEGAEAAQLLMNQFRQPVPLEQAVQLAHEKFCEWLATNFSNLENHEQPGAVATILEMDFQNERAEVFHLGDTRLYIGKEGQFLRVTEDQIDEEGKVIQDFGLNEIEPHWYDIELDSKVDFFIGTDGLYDILGENDTENLRLYFEMDSLDAIVQHLREVGVKKFSDNASGFFITVRQQFHEEQSDNRRILQWIAVIVMSLLLGIALSQVIVSLSGKGNDGQSYWIDSSNQDFTVFAHNDFIFTGCVTIQSGREGKIWKQEEGQNEI